MKPSSRSCLVTLCSLLMISACSDRRPPTEPALTKTMRLAVIAQQPSPIVIMRQNNGKVGAAPLLLTGGPTYHGDRIIPSTKVAAIYWATGQIYSGGPTPPSNGSGSQDGSLVGFFLNHLGGSPYFNINTTYYDTVLGCVFRPS